MADIERMICASGELEDGGAGVRFELHGAGAVVPAFIVRFNGVVCAYRNVCRHQATELDWNPGDFFDETKLYLICATHGALYEPQTGLCVAGPCPGARLARVAVDERDGKVYCKES